MATSLGQQLRAQATEQRRLSASLIEKLNESTQETVAVIVAQTSANLMDAVADLVDWIDGSDAINQRMQSRKNYAERNNAIRTAAARGDWAEYDRLIAGGSIGSAAGDAAQ